MDKKNLNRKEALTLTSIGLLVAAVVIAVLTAFMSTKVAEGGWLDFIRMLDNMQNAIMHLPNKWLIVIAILLVFTLKVFVPIPFPFIFMMTGVIFNHLNALIINTIGFSVVLLGKYYWGKSLGGGSAIKTLKKYGNVEDIMYNAGPAKLGILVALRLIPSIPVNIVSKIYGGLKFPVVQFVVASIIGFFPKIYTYTIMGGNISQPFTWKFMGPVVGLLVISGISTLVVNIVLEKRNGDSKNGKSKPTD